MTVTPTDGAGTRAFTVARAGDGARVFRSAIRHSRHVRFLRGAVPVLVVTAAVVAVALVELDPVRMLHKLPVDFSSLVISGTKITMQQPRLSGFTRDARPYELTAQAAAQDVTKPGILELQGIHGTSERQDGSTIDLTARSGIYDTTTEVMTLHQDVVVKSTSGLQAFLSEAVVDTHGGNISSDKPVEVRLQQGVINANRMEVTDSGNQISFGNGVTVVLTSTSNAPPTSATGAR